MQVLRYKLFSAAVDLFQPAASGAGIAALVADDAVTDTEQSAQDALITGLQTTKADKTELHAHTNIALLDAIAGHGNLALAGRTLTFTKTDGGALPGIDLGSDSAVWDSGNSRLTITHMDGSTTVANIPVANVLDAATPPVYNDVTKQVTFTWSDSTTSTMDVSALFDDTAYSGITKSDGAKTLTLSRLNASTTVIDLSTWFPTLVSSANLSIPANTTEGLISGQTLAAALAVSVPVNAIVADIAGLAAVNTTAFQGRERRYIQATKQYALWVNQAGGDVTPTTGGGSWFVVGADSTALTALSATVTNLGTTKADKTELHSHANKTTLDAVAGHAGLALAGLNLTLTKTDNTTQAVTLPSSSSSWNAGSNTLTITHEDGGVTTAAISQGTVLDVNTPPVYNGTTNVLTLTWSDASTTDIDLNDLFDSAAVSAVTKTDASKTLHFTQLNAGVINLDISSWFPSLLTSVQANDAASAVEGLVSGERIKGAIDQHEYFQPFAGPNLEWGKKYQLYKTSNYVFPDPATGGVGKQIHAIPYDGSWHDFDPATRWSGAGAVTIGLGQVDSISTNYGMLIFAHDISNAGNIRVHG